MALSSIHSFLYDIQVRECWNKLVIELVYIEENNEKTYFEIIIWVLFGFKLVLVLKFHLILIVSKNYEISEITFRV